MSLPIMCWRFFHFRSNFFIQETDSLNSQRIALKRGQPTNDEIKGKVRNFGRFKLLFYVLISILYVYESWLASSVYSSIKFGGVSTDFIVLYILLWTVMCFTTHKVEHSFYNWQREILFLHFVTLNVQQKL